MIDSNKEQKVSEVVGEKKKSAPYKTHVKEKAREKKKKVCKPPQVKYVRDMKTKEVCMQGEREENIVWKTEHKKEMW